MDFTRTLAFAAIWCGLAVYSVDLLKFTAAKADAPVP
jgi:EamA domain-containing membrane protein RarD